MVSKVLGFVIGSRLPTSLSIKERLSNIQALAILCSDVLSSVAYATEEMLLILMLVGVAALQWSVPLSVAIVGLLAILVTSYRQTIGAYPGGGGAYTVAKENLGTWPGLVAASGLLIDYLLTVAVSIVAGVSAITSAFTQLVPFRIELGLLGLLLLMLVNLRGVRQTGYIFTLPTLLFVASMLVLLAMGVVRYLLQGGLPASPAPAPAGPMESVSVFLLLRAFASGCAALTGTEAVADGVRVFKPPEAENARRVIVWMGVILAVLFLGTTFLANGFGVLPAQDETVLSQLGRLILGGGPLYYILQFSTLTILVLAANTSFADFPRVASLLGQDGFLPRQLANLGSRLVYSNGIILLAVLSGVLIAAARGSVHHLIPLYAVGVFLSFTLSQLGMVHHWHVRRGSGWVRGILINGVGATVTGLVLLIVMTTKFTHGAWLIVLLIPLLLYIFSRVHSHYERVAEDLSLDGFALQKMPAKHVVIVPVSGVHRAVLKALAYASVLSSDVRGVHIASDMREADKLRAKWMQHVPNVPLTTIYSPYRIVIGELIKYLDSVEAQENSVITVVIPEFVPRRWWEMLLHSQTAFWLKMALTFRRKSVPVVSVPHHLR